MGDDSDHADVKNGNVFPVIREVTTDALRYWEFRRVFYNLLLTIIASRTSSPHGPAHVKR
jgi:hypothetical protein